VKRLSLSLALLFLLVAPSVSQAQTVRLESQTSVPVEAYLSTGYEEAVLPVTLGADVGLRALSRPLVVGIDLTVPAFARSNFSGLLHAALDLNPKQGWLLRALAGMAVLTAQNQAFGAIGPEGQLGLLAGYSAPRWLVGAEAIGKLTVFDVVTTTALARSFGATSGGVLWLPAYGLEAGVRAGALFGPVELALRAGFDRKGDYNFVIPPAYATVSMGFRWNG
jgi:hypothetical protein